MNLRRLFGTLLVVVGIIGTLPLLAGTKIVHRWVLTGLPMPHFSCRA